MQNLELQHLNQASSDGTKFTIDAFARIATFAYDEKAGNMDEEGNRFFKNTDSNGRFHSDWCSMIYSSLMIARSLLTEDGVIFISIDDNEVENLRKDGGWVQHLHRKRGRLGGLPLQRPTCDGKHRANHRREVTATLPLPRRQFHVGCRQD